MQSLANRHEDRAQRIANNRTEANSGFNNGSMSVGTAAIAYRDFAAIASRLPEDQRAEFDEARRAIDDEFVNGYRSLAESPDGSGDTMAGIGVVNAAVVPAAMLATSDDGKGASVGSDPAWGDKPVTMGGLPESQIDPKGGNVNGLALSDQLGDAGGWGTQTPTTRTAEEGQSGNGGGTGTDGASA